MAASASSSGANGVPPGFRFHPTDEELLLFYLKKKVSFEKFDLEVIREVDLNKIEPWELQERCRIGSTPQNEWYFFSHKDRKYPTGSRTNRATNAGFWKATGRDKSIRTSYRKIGMRKTLVFYRGRAPHGQKSDWIMHEYRLDDGDDPRPATVRMGGWCAGCSRRSASSSPEPLWKEARASPPPQKQPPIYYYHLPQPPPPPPSTRPNKSTTPPTSTTLTTTTPSSTPTTFPSTPSSSSAAAASSSSSSSTAAPPRPLRHSPHHHRAPAPAFEFSASEMAEEEGDSGGGRDQEGRGATQGPTEWAVALDGFSATAAATVQRGGHEMDLWGSYGK
uniref:NAC domain-containing protein n=1 Tax=Ananas comosus var. bracteatus TaxID=296719 RepID=A0A6V7Q1Z3_ANACO|nr:unnamed protein product [Ananas comosus var. bracteatus]